MRHLITFLPAPDGAIVLSCMCGYYARTPFGPMADFLAIQHTSQASSFEVA